MSLINQMLQDLDARRAAQESGVSLPADVRPLPPARTTRWPWYVAGIGIVAVAAGGYHVLQQREMATGEKDVAVVSAAPAAHGAPVPSPLSAPPASPSSNPMVASDAPPPRSLPDNSVSLRLADVLSDPPVKTASTKAAVEPVPKSPESRRDEKQVPPAKVVEPQARPAPQVPDVPVSPSADTRTGKTQSIEKKDANASPRERGEAGYRKAIGVLNQGRPGEAIEALQEALRLDAQHGAARQLLVRLLLESRRTDEAIQALQEGLQGQPTQAGWAMSLARLQVDRGDLAAAAQTLQRSQLAALDNASYLGFSAHVQQRLGHHKEAGVLYELAARLAPDDGRWWFGLGMAMDAEGRNDRAVEAFQRARQCGNLSRELMTVVEQKLR